MQQALRLQTTILPGGRIELSDAALRPGDEVEVIVLLGGEPSERRSALDVLDEAPGRRLLRTEADVEAYLRAERDAWQD